MYEKLGTKDRTHICIYIYIHTYIHIHIYILPFRELLPSVEGARNRLLGFRNRIGSSEPTYMYIYIYSTYIHTHTGEPDLLFEEFEAIHQGLFSVTVSFFAAFSLLILAVNHQIWEWDNTFRHELLTLKLAEDEVCVYACVYIYIFKYELGDMKC